MATPPAANPSLILLCFSFLFSTFLNPIVATDHPVCNPADKAVLLKVRDRFGGIGGPLYDWDNATNCCGEWSYVGCDTRNGQVNWVGLGHSSGLSGTLPEELGDLPFLTFLSLVAQRDVTGHIPESFGNLKRLERLELDENRLTGPVQAFLGRMKRLRYLNVSHNLLTDSIPELPVALTVFDVSYNQLCGGVPGRLQKFGRSAFEHNKCLCGPPLPYNCQ